MEMMSFLRRLSWHAAWASSVFFLIALATEYVFPGSVLPYIDLVDGSLILLGILIAAIALQINEKTATEGDISK